MAAPDYILQALNLRRDQLQGKLNARDGQAGFAENVIELRAALEQLDAEIAERAPIPEPEAPPAA